MGFPAIWALFLVANILTFNLFWSVLLTICLILSLINLYGYWKCRKDHKQKLSSLIQAGAMSAAMNMAGHGA